MNPTEDAADRLGLPADIDVLTALADADDDTTFDIETAAAGARIGERLLRGHRALARGPATVTHIHARAAVVVMRVPGWTVQPLAASSADRAARAVPAAQKRVDRELGLEFIRSPAGAEQTRISVQSQGIRAASGDIVRVDVRRGEENTEILVVLYTDETGTVTGHVITRALTMAEDLEISIMPVAALGAGQTSAVTDAVRCSLTAGRNAWRRVAKALPGDHPVRAAIVAGLT
ncbi:hypothetical protein [Nocardia shimofusensis]|uniref:hypothetical protein n=1 Tax=Nocardia shimofusensis TaxID=228596 RepID=UPI00082B317E|nr:hypothetical protein [Nocardia shimofusensis]